MEKQALILVDDHPLILEGMMRLINQEEDLEVVACAENVDSAMQLVKVHNPKLVVVDISLKGVSGLSLISLLRENFPQIHILVVSMYDEKIFAERVLQLGAKGYLSKERSTSEIIQAIRKILAGNVYFRQEILEQIVLKMSSAGLQPNTVPVPTALLSPRELEIFHLLGNGYKSKRIAILLHLSSKTVDCHVANIKQKLKIQSAGELSQYAAIWFFSHCSDKSK